ncbi:MAG: hypothetical protein N2Z74_04535, partial [Syntrophales bacterium]|nr:hypothetical protein [Syntrophales bacterium]
AYDLTASPTEAWTLMAIIDSISQRHTGDDLILIIDTNLERRIAKVDLSKGDAAVTQAIASIKDSVKPITVADARDRMRKTINDDNTLNLVTLGELIAQGRQVIDSVGPQVTRYLVGSLIEGMPYACGSYSGRTGRIGQFTHHEGDSCTFRLGKMSFTVTPDKMKKGYISAYDLTSSPTEAWTLMAIIDSISQRRPGTDLILIIDANLEHRIPKVDLSKGDAAVTQALATFMGTVKTTTVAEARDRIRKTLKDDNTLALSREELLAQGKQILDSLGLHIENGKVWEGNRVIAGGRMPQVTIQSNIVNLRFYDNTGNPLYVSTVYGDCLHWEGQDGGEWLWVTAGQNPNNATPHFGNTCTILDGSNIASFELDVGRHADSGVANSFRQWAQWLGGSSFGGSPITLYAAGANADENNIAGFPSQLNFAFREHIMVPVLRNIFYYNNPLPYSITINVNNQPWSFTGVYCPDIILGLGSSSSSLEQWLDAAKNLGEFIGETIEAVSEEGLDLAADVKALKSFTEFFLSAFDLSAQNWWIITNVARTANARVNYKYNNGIITHCWPATPTNTYYPGTNPPLRYYNIDVYNPMVAVITSTQDDHTFDFHLAWPGQTLYGIVPLN